MKIDLDRAGRLDLKAATKEALGAREILEGGTGPGADMRGWLDLPAGTTPEALGRIDRAAQAIQETDALVLVGIGGSFQGASAILDALVGPFGDGLPIHFAGHHLDAAYHRDLLAHLRDKRYSVNVISKSGTTLEPSVAFDLLRSDLESRFGRGQLGSLVFATTDPEAGSLRALANEVGMTTFPVPDDVGGRYSVLSPVGLLPLAAKGIDISALLEGARAMAATVRDPANTSLESNPAVAYAAYRIAARKAGRSVELMACATPRLAGMADWWKQLFGESEGKDGGGLLPVSLTYTTDLHSLGQWIQEGPPIAIETILDVVRGGDLKVPDSTGGLCGPMAGRSVHDLARTIARGALEAHSAAGVPCVRIELDAVDERNLGGLLYMMEYACGISAHAQGVNPFDQPGVEAYKREARKLLENREGDDQ